MNTRKGMSRVVRVMAVAYWAVALCVVAATAYEAYGRSATIYAEPVSPGWVNEDPFRIKVRDGRTVVITAFDHNQARAGAEAWAKAHPRPNAFFEVLSALGLGLGVSSVIFAVLWAIYRGLRWVALGFIDTPVKSETGS